MSALIATGCANSAQPGLPAGPDARTNRAAHGIALANHSWMKRLPAGDKLLYVTNSGSGTVTVYTYPKLSYVGQLTGFQQPSFDCADKSGNVWIIDYDGGTATEYAHGGTTPINQLSDLPEPYACSVDPKSGSLAVAVNYNNGSVFRGEVAVFQHASGAPAIYTDPNSQLLSGLTYDNHGNLFVDGFGPGNAFHYAKLPAGSSTFTDIALSTTPDWPGAVIWDGIYVDVGDYSNKIYQTQGATVVNTIELNLPSAELRGYVVASTKVIAAGSYANLVATFSYPQGGSPKKTLSFGVSTPWDVVLSK